MVNIMGADVLATQGARALAAMILLCWTELIRSPASERLTNIHMADFS